MDLNQWNLEAVNMPDDQLVADTASGSAVKVAVMDSGITPPSGIEIAGTVDFANLGKTMSMKIHCLMIRADMGPELPE